MGRLESRGRGKGQLRPASKSDNKAGFCCSYLLPSLVYSSMLVTLETAVGAYRGILLLCSCGQRCPVVHGKENLSWCRLICSMRVTK